MKVTITGATGMVGKGVLLECLDHEKVEKVLVIGRNPVDVSHPKLEQLLHKDFSDFSTAKTKLSGYDACFLCMGISSAGMKENDFKKITYDYTLALARELFPLNPEMTITYVSGEGTDSSEKGRVMWARVKGKTENDLIKLGFKQSFMFRPGVIIPERGIKSKTKSYQFIYDYFLWLVRLFKTVAPNAVVSTTQIGKAMINAALYGYNVVIVKPKDIIQLAEK